MAVAIECVGFNGIVSSRIANIDGVREAGQQPNDFTTAKVAPSMVNASSVSEDRVKQHGALPILQRLKPILHNAYDAPCVPGRAVEPHERLSAKDR